MNENTVHGAAEKELGKAENAEGNVTGDIGDQAKGALRQLGGAAEELFGRAKDDAHAAADNDRAERS